MIVEVLLYANNEGSHLLLVKPNWRRVVFSLSNQAPRASLRPYMFYSTCRQTFEVETSKFLLEESHLEKHYWHQVQR